MGVIDSFEVHQSTIDKDKEHHEKRWREESPEYENTSRNTRLKVKEKEQVKIKEKNKAEKPKRS